MKKFKFLPMVFALALAVVSTLAFTSNSAEDFAIVNGWEQGATPFQCTETEVECQTEISSNLCKSGAITLYAKPGARCDVPLYRVE